MNTPVYPFETDPNDHCETSKEAYEDISNLLEILAIEMNKSKETLRIYDPYYCEGRVIERLRSLGFQSVYNKNEDFYAVCKSNNCPEFDCIVTNPPYSADHMEILLKFCLLSLKPWFLLLPNFVYTKEYYIKRILLKKVLLDMIYYVIPMNRYRYTTPKGRRQKKSSKYTSPFASFWYCNGYRYTDKMLSSVAVYENVQIIRNLNQLPLEMVPEEDHRKKRLRNSQKRSKHKKRKKLKLLCNS